MTDIQTEALVEQTAPVILTFQMTLDNVNSLIGILSQLPFEKVSGYIQSIRGQSIAQLQAAQASTLTDTPTE